MIKHLDLFSGYGGFTIAHGDSIETIGFSEVDKYASAVLKFRFPNIKNYGDIKKIRGDMLGQVDLITAGSPCQDLSIAGKRAGLDGARSGLFMEFIRLLKECKPKYCIWENVKGAFSSNGGRDFAEVIYQMEQTGYALQWKVLNAKDYGVPQNRERIFMVGIRGGSGREILFEGRDSKQTLKQLKRGSKGTNCGKAGLYMVPDTSYCLDANYYKGTTYKDYKTKKRRQLIEEGSRVRRLTPLECERLMGLEDGWTSKGVIDGKEVNISDTQRYKMCGNGVVVPCVESIYKSLF